MVAPVLQARSRDLLLLALVAEVALAMLQLLLAEELVVVVLVLLPLTERLVAPTQVAVAVLVITGLAVLAVPVLSSFAPSSVAQRLV